MILTYPNEILTRECEDFDFEKDNAKELAEELVNVMVDNNGIALSAPQIGKNVRVFALNTTPKIVMFNPKIVWKSENEIYMEEGCLSFPKMMIKIKRPESVRVRYKMPNGQVETRKFSGLTARNILHEMDHLDGVLFTARASKYHLEKAKKALTRRL